MGRLVLYMTMSLDGFIAGPDDRVGQELGRDGGRLFNWLDDRMSDGPSGQVFRELLATGAVISGRRTFELAGRWQGDHHDGVPIFVEQSSPSFTASEAHFLASLTGHVAAACARPCSSGPLPRTTAPNPGPASWR
jgi:dihydrofolate reductase